MNVPTKTVANPAFQLLLYRKPLHPGLFPPKSRKSIAHGQYESEAWMLQGGHAVRFRLGTFTASELVVDKPGGLPVDAAVTAIPCAGEHEFEHVFSTEKVKYITSIQTETLSESLYQSTFEEMVEFAAETEALIHKWEDAEGGNNLSVLDVQRHSREVHTQGYHLVAGPGLVLRTQTIFEHK